MFRNLRNKYGRERKRLASLKRSGSGLRDVFQPKIYGFMSWLAPYVQNRETVTNLVQEDTHDEENEEVEGTQGMQEEDEYYNLPDESVASEGNYDQSQPFSSPVVRDARTSPVPLNSQVTGRQKHTGRRNKVKSKENENDSLQKQEEEISKLIRKRLTETQTKTEDGIYGELLEKKLCKLPKEMNIQAKHGIDNIMFKYSME